MYFFTTFIYVEAQKLLFLPQKLICFSSFIAILQKYCTILYLYVLYFEFSLMC